MISTKAKEKRADVLGFSAKTEPSKDVFTSTSDDTDYRSRDLM